MRSVQQLRLTRQTKSKTGTALSLTFPGDLHDSNQAMPLISFQIQRRLAMFPKILGRLLFVLFIAVITLTTMGSPINAATCTGTSPPCVLTNGYAGPASDDAFNARQGINPYETHFTSTTKPATSYDVFFEVDDTLSALPVSNATSNPIMAQPLYVAGITVSSPVQGTCNPCNMVVAVTLNDTVFAWKADGTGAGNLLWSRQGTGGAAGTNALYYDDCNGPGSMPVANDTTLQFEGILSTPVIDASGATPMMFLVSRCQTSGALDKYYLHQLDLTTGLDAITKRHIGGSGGDFTGINEGWQLQRPALLQVKNSNNTTTPTLIYILFGTGVQESYVNKDYTGWLVAYQSTSTALSPIFAYSNEPTGCGTGGGLKDDNVTSNGQCTGNSGSPSCDCYINAPYIAPNWGGHGGGCWMSGNGPAASPAGAISSDNAVHTFFGCGNGGFQTGLGSTATDNFGNTFMDFRLTQTGYDSTAPFQTFTPDTPAAGVGPALPTTCGCTGPPTTGCVACTNTLQALNANDWDQSVGGVALFKDLGGVQRAVTIDTAGYGYFLQQGLLCGSGYTIDTPCIGFATGDPGSWTFGAVKTLCSGVANTCDRAANMSVGDNRGSGASRGVTLNFWPYQERLTALRLSDNSTAQTGTGQLKPDTGVSAYTMQLNSSCTIDVNCLTEQIVPGDSLSLDATSCTCGTGGCPVVTSVKTVSSTDSELTLNMTVTSAFGSSCSYPQSFTYKGYFVTPAHDSTPTVGSGGWPGAAIMMTTNCFNSPCSDGLIWAILPDTDSAPDNTDRGVGTLLAYTALPNASDILTNDFTSSSSDVWCASSFARPTIVNASVFVPAYAVSCPSGGTGCSRTQTFTNCKHTGTGSIGSGSPPYPSGMLRYH
jgi:hypothetical protein